MTMCRLLFTLLLAVSAATLSANGGAPAPDNKGTDFILAFPQNVNVPATPTHRMTLFIAAEDATTAEISGPLVVTRTFDIPAFSVLEVFFDTTSLQVSAGEVSDKGIRVRSIDPVSPLQEGAPIAVYGLNRRMGSAGAYIALPVDVLGTEYRALSRPGTSQVTVVGTQPSTTVTITQYSTVAGVTTVSAPVNIVLNHLQTYLLQDPTADLTGTLVTANNPIVVYSGNQIGSVNGGSTDHMIEQLVPVNDWGNEFIVAPILPASELDVVRVLAHESGTEIELNGVAQTILGAGQFYEFTQPSASGSRVSTSRPALVAYYNRGDSPTTDTFAMLVPPTGQFGRQYLFKTPGAPFTAPFGSNRLNIVVKDGDEAGLLLNNAALPAGTVWTSVNGYRYARVTIPAGTGQRLEHSEPTVRFGAWVYGHASGEGYGYVAGQLVEDQTPPELLAVPGDLTIEATGPGGATVTWAVPTATDFGRGELEVTCSPESGSMFGLGTTVVTCSAADPAGNTAAESFNVTVQDTTPPTFDALPGMTAEATSPAGAVVQYHVTATDTVSQNVPVFCGRESGSVFGVGTTVVQCRATDPAGNMATGFFHVTVQDTTAPTFDGSGITVHATSPAGAVVPYTVTATDTVSQSVTVVCKPPSGSLFPVGADKLTFSTRVECTATDESNNSATQAFMVTVTNSAPLCSSAIPSMSTIPFWRRGFVPVTIKGVTDPDQDSIRIRIVGIFQDEPASRRGANDDDDEVDKAWHHLSFDGFVIGTRLAFIRAERSARGDGRVYHIRFTATDHIGARCQGEVIVGVPRHRHGAAVDGGALYDSTAGFRPPNHPGNPNHGRRNDDEDENDD
jgi:hypothetical protein